MIGFRQATLTDTDAITRVESESWPAFLAAPRSALASRISIYPSGQWLALRDQRIVGAAFAQRVHPELLAASQPTYDRVTDNATFQNTHDPLGSVYQLVGVGVAPEGQGCGVGRQLIDRQLQFARSLDGVQRIVGFTRPVGLHRFPELSIDDYLKLRGTNGRLQDPVLSFHLDSGARLVSVHPGFRSADRDARGYGVLIEYPV